MAAASGIGKMAATTGIGKMAAAPLSHSRGVFLDLA
jgi:hypothetical protein